jgi:hypothetical protein
VNLRQKLLLMFSVTVVGLVVAVAWIVSVRVRRVFDDIDRQQTAALVNQFQREFSRRAGDTAAALDRMAASDPLKQIAFELSNGGDAASYLQAAIPLAQEYRLDDLELVAHDGSIISSFQWTARFGYKEPAIAGAGQPAFLKQEDQPDGTSQIGIFAARRVDGSDPPLYVVGGRQLDAWFSIEISAAGSTRTTSARQGRTQPSATTSLWWMRPGPPVKMQPASCIPRRIAPIAWTRPRFR